MTEPERIVHPQYFYDPQIPPPTARTWLKHIALLAITFCTVTVAGSIFPFGPNQSLLGEEDPQNLQELLNLLFSLPAHYAILVIGALQGLLQNPEYLAYGLKFSASLLFILTCHEMGHYIACRLYKVDATLPFFIPMPPMIGPAGTFGAFIKIKSPMPSRRAVFDIGVAGPIAGFLPLLPIAAAGVITMETAPGLVAVPGSLVFSDPLLMRILGAGFGVDPSVGIGNPFYFAAWVGLLVTALNLIPSGQLDGGHVIYAVFGERVHRLTGRIAFPAMAVLSIVGLIFYGSPSGFLIAIILAVMMRVKHPEPWDQTPLDAKRKVLAFATLIIFVLCFVPFPIRIS